jgi:hypothetical protein
MRPQVVQLLPQRGINVGRATHFLNKRKKKKEKKGKGKLLPEPNVNTILTAATCSEKTSQRSSFLDSSMKDEDGEGDWCSQ